MSKTVKLHACGRCKSGPRILNHGLLKQAERNIPRQERTSGPTALAERNRVYSDNRILYPMKRVDFDPKGNRNQQNRGKSGYKRISWNEALDIVSGEIKRITENFGGSAITGLTSSHHNWGVVGYKMGPFARFMNMLNYTPVMDNPDSWEGWHWGATHMYGFYWRLGMPEQFDLLDRCASERRDDCSMVK